MHRNPLIFERVRYGHLVPHVAEISITFGCFLKATKISPLETIEVTTLPPSPT